MERKGGGALKRIVQKSYFLRMTLLTIVIIVAVAAAIGVSSYHISKSIITENNKRSHQDLVWQIGQSVKAELDKGLNILTVLYYDEDLVGLLEKEEQHGADRVAVITEIQNLYYQAKAAQPINNCSVALLSRSGFSVGNFIHEKSFDYLQQLGIYDGLAAEKSVHWEYDDIGYTYHNKNNRVLRGIKTIQDHQGEVLAYMIVEIRELIIYRIYKGNLNLGNEIFIVDRQNRIVSSSNRESLGQAVAGFYPDFDPRISNGVVSSALELAIYQDIFPNGWRIVDQIPNHILLQGTVRIRNTILAVVAAALFFAVLIALVIMNQLKKPVKELNYCFHQVKNNDLSVRMQPYEEVEFKDLSAGFNVMAEDLKTHMDDLIRQQKRINEMNLENLQAQINPHFLYNTLDSVVYLSEAGDTEKIKMLTSSLINILRKTIGNTKDTCTVKEELQSVEDYIRIQNIRYNGNIKVNIIADEETENRLMLKMLLQPIIENSILHGLAPKAAVGIISVIVQLTPKQELMIEVIDNGTGMEQSKADRILDKTWRHSRFSGIGVSNVQERIKILYGNRYGMKITSIPDTGTTTEIILPDLGTRGET